MSERRGLGRGLSSLLAGLETSPKGVLKEVEVTEISPSPHQARTDVEPEALAGLVQSVKEFGLIHPVVVRQRAVGFELIAGERRWRAAKEAGLGRIPALIKSPTDEASREMALVENLHREDLNVLEEAAAYQQLMADFGLTQSELAGKVGRSRVAVTNILRLLKLPDYVKGLVGSGKLSGGHARALLSLDTAEGQKELAAKIVREGLSVRQTERICSLHGLPPLPAGESRRTKRVFRKESEALARFFGVDVRIRPTGGERGRIEIRFDSAGELDRIIAVLEQKGPGARP